MSKTNLTRPLYVSPVKERNYEKYGHIDNQCICCGKPMQSGESLFVHMNENWEAVNPEVVTEDNCNKLTGANSQGIFPIGNDCAKKMAGFTFLSNL